MLAQDPLQSVNPSWQDGWQVPFEQTLPPEQTVPHAPQLRLSDKVFVQCVPHRIWEPGHEQDPFRQSCSGEQEVPHVPQ